MKPVTILSIIVDGAILISFLTLPRTGMEAMASAFLLIPLVAARRMIQKAGNAEHALFCDLLAEERDLSLIEKRLTQNPELPLPCVTVDGDRVEPVMHAIIYSYGSLQEATMPL